MVRVTDIVGAVRYREKVFMESVRFVDPGFFDMFTFPLRMGHKDVLNAHDGLILSQEVAYKYFGNENPIGKQFVLIFDGTQRLSFFIKGVAEKFPQNASFSFNILAPFELYMNIRKLKSDDWNENVKATFIQVNNPNDIRGIESQMKQYIARQNEANIERPIRAFSYEPLETLSWESQEINGSISSGSTPQILILLFVIGLFLLLQACVNYINITLSSAARRMREIGIRKVVGAVKRELVFQFLSENIFMCLISLIFGLLITQSLLLPGLMMITGNVDDISLFGFFRNIRLWFFLIVLLVFTGIGAGIYPALVIARFEPVKVLKGILKIGGKKRLTGLLLAFQFSITFLILSLVFILLQNNTYQKERNWGYDQDNLIGIYLKHEQFGILWNHLVQNSNIVQIAGTRDHIGRSGQHSIVMVENDKHEVVRFDVGENYLETMGIRLSSGRLFDRQIGEKSVSDILVNQQFAQVLGWKDAIGKVVRFDNQYYHVIGTVEDFHYRSFFETIDPVMIRLVPSTAFRYLICRTHENSTVQVYQDVQTVWRDIYPDMIFNGFYQESVFDHMFQNNNVITNILAATASITLIISCMGLFGLVYLLISNRLKDLSIHKVLGASDIKIAHLITHRYFYLMIISVLIALPPSLFLVKALLEGAYHTYHIPISPLPFMSAAFIVFFTAFLTIIYHVYGAATRNPIDAIRYE